MNGLNPLQHNHTSNFYTKSNLFLFYKMCTNPARNAAGYRAAGRKAGPHGGGNRIGDHVKNGADGGIMPLKCDETGGKAERSDIRASAVDVCRVGDGDGEHRRFLFSVATIASFATFVQSNCTNCLNKLLLIGNH